MRFSFGQVKPASSPGNGSTDPPLGRAHRLCTPTEDLSLGDEVARARRVAAAAGARGLGRDDAIPEPQQQERGTARDSGCSNRFGAAGNASR